MYDRQNAIALIAVGAIAAFVGANTLRPTLDADTGWHLRIGQFIDNQGTVPATDPISRIGIDDAVRWQAYSWLHEWIMHRWYVARGDAGILEMRTALVGLSTGSVFAFVFGRFGFRPVSFLLSLGFAFTLTPMTTERPWHYTIAFTAITLRSVLIARESGSAQPVYVLIPLFALWANLHIQFVLGWLILGLWCVDPGRSSCRPAVVISIGCILATFANPYHIRLLEVILDYATQSAPRELIQELAPPSVRSLPFLAAASLVLGAVHGIARRRTIGFFEFGLLLAAGLVGMRMNRDLWFAALLAIAAIRQPFPASSTVRSVSVLLTVLTVLIGMRILNSSGLLGNTDIAAAQARAYPVHAVEFLKAERPPGPLFNDISWGGHLAWALPEYPVTIDGRTNLYGNTRLLQSSRTWSTPDGWMTDVEFAKCKVIIARVGRPLTDALRGMPDEWRILHQDAVAVVFVRK